MSEKLIDQAALEMYRRSRRLGGVKRPAADEEWRELGPKGRKMWRELAEVLHLHGPAPCELEPEAWWPAPSQGIDALAVRICAGCPGQAEGLAYAEAAGERHGVWGGTTPEGRRRSMLLATT